MPTLQLFSGVSETLLIPLAGRALARQWHPDFRDEKAEAILQSLKIDTRSFEKDRWTMMATAIRAHLIDESVRKFMRTHPKVLLLNLGAGLCTRFFRVDDGRLHTIDLDLPQVIEVKRQLLPESNRYRFMARSVFDFSWMEEIDRTDEAVIMVIEGVLMYFDREHNRQFFRHCADAFPGAELLFDFCNHWVAHFSPVPAVWKTQARFKCGFSNFAEIQALEPRLRLKRLYSLPEELGKFDKFVHFGVGLPAVRRLYQMAHVVFSPALIH